MPRAENDTSARGLPKGAEKAQQNFVQSTGGGGNASDEAASAMEVQSPNVEPLQSNVTQSAPPQQDNWQPPKGEPGPAPNMLENGMNLDDVLYAPSDRPGEPLGTGVTNTSDQIKLSQILQGLPQSPDVQALQQLAASKGL